MLVMPNTLTEASNLLLHGAGDARRFLDELARLIDSSHEAIIVSKQVVRNTAFCRLGVADAALLEAVSHRRRLITADLNLYLAAKKRDYRSAVNFIDIQKQHGHL